MGANEAFLLLEELRPYLHRDNILYLTAYLNLWQQGQRPRDEDPEDLVVVLAMDQPQRRHKIRKIIAAHRGDMALVHWRDFTLWDFFAALELPTLTPRQHLAELRRLYGPQLLAAVGLAILCPLMMLLFLVLGTSTG